MIFPYLVIGIPVILQIICIIHIIRTDRERTWIYIVLFIPLVGCVVYLVAEILPSLLSGKKSREIKSAFTNTVFGGKRIADLEKLLALSDTYQNRQALADEYLASKMYDKAIEMYQSCLNGIYANDPHLMQTIAHAYHLKGDAANARAYFDKVQAVQPIDKKYRTEYAVVLAELGEHEKAEAILSELDKGFIIEGIYRYAVLLENLGRTDEARDKFKRVLFVATTLPKYVYREDRKWINLSKEALNRF